VRRIETRRTSVGSLLRSWETVFYTTDIGPSNVTVQQEEAESAEGGCCKVGRAIETYDLDGENEVLRRYWTGEGETRYSLRALADYFNQRVLRAAMEDAGVEFLEGEVENTYRLLTDSDVSRGMRTHARNRLDRSGVDPDRLEAAFVSHQTMHSHLTSCLGASLEETAGTDDEDRVEKALAKIRALQNRTSAVTGDTLERLEDGDDLDLDEFSVFVNVSVSCDSCGTHYDVGTLLEQGGCDCQR